MLQLGLELLSDGKDICSKIFFGEYDYQIVLLGNFLKSLKIPVFLRAGYEFNQPKKICAG